MNISLESTYIWVCRGWDTKYYESLGIPNGARVQGESIGMCKR